MHNYSFSEQEILNDFIKFSSQFLHLGEESTLDICKRFQVHALPQKTHIVNFGQVYNHIYFVYSGLVRGYYFDEGKDITNWFAKKNDFVYTPRSYLTKEPSEEAIETINEAVVLSLSFDDMNYLYDKYPDTAKIGRILTEHYLHRYDKKVRLLRISSAEVRVKKFINQYPKEFQNLPHKHLASYLGIAQETLSRILARKN